MDTAQITIYVIAGLINLALVVITFMKGKPVFGVIGIFVPIFALIGAIRLAKPESSWARSRYNDAMMAEARSRFA